MENAVWDSRSVASIVKHSRYVRKYAAIRNVQGREAMKSILQNEKECFVTKSTMNLHEHHIYYGRANRRISEANGFKVWLRADFHNMDPRKDVHHNPGKGLDLHLKQLCQKKYEETHSRNEFIALIGRSYL